MPAQLDFNPLNPTSVTVSRWKNNNNVTARFRLLTHEKKGGIPNRRHQESADCKASVFLNVTLAPGEEIELLSEYDDAIRKVSKATGEVVSGLCPWLTKVGEEEVPIHPSLDYKRAIAEESATELMKLTEHENRVRATLKEMERVKVYDKIEAETKTASPSEMRTASPSEMRTASPSEMRSKK